jgi:uncharacterized membrane protein (UPF0127 family)
MRWNRFKILSVSCLGLCLAVISCKDNTRVQESKSVVISFKKEGTLQLIKASNDSIIKSIDIEIADNDYEIQTGLMYRNSMKIKNGMLFIFNNEDYRSFYMKNTHIPLDIIYVSADSTIVSFQKNAEPFNETSLPSEAPAMYVLELNAGLSDEWKLEKGDRIKFTPLD